ncbi:MAG: NAD(+)/NADH kinase [Anaerolineae bacterium]|nr:NAD(+)/NADH kinase [Anaerolineae bacterium]
MQTVGVLAHPLRPATTPLAEQIAESLRARGLDVWLRTGAAVSATDAPEPGTDMVVAIGGDGAMLRAARVCAPSGVPVLGINVGRLGFLTEVRGPKFWPEALDALQAGSYWIEQRMMLEYAAHRQGKLLCWGDALNDVVVGRGVVASTVWLETYIDGGWTTTYAADALIIATATGSTAYALGVGGPILPPELRNILVVPVAAHLSMDRPIVVSEGAVIDVVVPPENRPDLTLTADGALAEKLQAEDRVTVQASDHVSRFVRLRERGYFYRSLLDRLEPRHPFRSRPRQDRLPPVGSPPQPEQDS